MGARIGVEVGDCKRGGGRAIAAGTADELLIVDPAGMRGGLLPVVRKVVRAPHPVRGKRSAY
ncbi:MAG: hypothetical protein AMXMBFR25_00050 [Lysobacterales bacterium]